VVVSFMKPKPPPVSDGQGGAVGLPAEPYTAQEREAMLTLGLPQGGVCLTQGQALSVAKQRIYMDEAYSIALFNWRSGEVSNQVADKYLKWSDEQLKAEREAQSGWFNRYRGEMGFALGVATTILIVYGLDSARK